MSDAFKEYDTARNLLALHSARIAGAITSWKDNPAIPEYIRNDMKKLEMQDTYLRSKALSLLAIAAARLGVNV